jgi:adenylate cyclase
MSRTLVAKALEDAPQPTYYGWMRSSALKVTVQEGVDWVICAAAKVPGEPALLFYVAGSDAQGQTPRPEVARFVGLVADIVGRSFSNDHLQEWQGRLRRFFAPPVIEKVLAGPDLSALDPRLAQSTVLFFDIRGSSRRSEAQNEVILGYVRELRKAMTAMTEIIMEEGGVALQYMGDGILACWNVPLGDPDHVDRACRAAVRMAAGLGRVTAGWKCGLGIHTGEVVAGAIGSDQVFAYGVLGPVVNQASRIEGITKIIGAPILVTKEVVSALSPGVALKRRAGRFQPAGMDVALELYELRDPRSDQAPLSAYEAALADFEAGRWTEAYQALLSLTKRDGPSSYLKLYMEGSGLKPPEGWNGVIALDQK